MRKLDVPCVEFRFLALLALLLVMLQRAECVFAQEEDHRNVDERHAAHGDIGDVPEQIGTQTGTDEDHQRSDEPVDEHEGLARHMSQQVCKALVHVEQIAQQCGKREQDHGNGDEDRTEITQHFAQCCLNVRRAGQLCGRLHAGAHAHECRRTAHNDRIKEYGQYLHEALLCRMADLCGGGGIRRGADAGLVAEQAALDAVHHAGTAETAEDRLEVKCLREDCCKHRRQGCDIQHDDDQGYQYIGSAHHRHQKACGLDDTGAAADQAVADDHCQQQADDPGTGGLIVETVAREGGLQVVRCQHIEADAVGQDQEHGEHHCQRTIAHCCLNIVSRTAVAALRSAFLIDLRKGTLHECGGTADDRDEPHPEHGAEAAQAQRRGHAHDIARSHTGCGGDHERLEGRYALAVLGLLHHCAQLLSQQAELRKAGLVCKVDARCDQQDDQQIAVQRIADTGDGRFDDFVHLNDSFVQIL